MKLVLHVFVCLLLISVTIMGEEQDEKVSRQTRRRLHHRHRHLQHLELNENDGSDVETTPSPSTEQPKTCVSCVDREVLKNFTREDIKDKILRKLGLSTPPNVTMDSVSAHMLQQFLYHYKSKFDRGDEMQNDQEIGGASQDDVHTRQINIVAQQPSPYSLPESILQLWPIQHFNLRQSKLLSDAEEWRDVMGARLWIYLPPAQIDEDDVIGKELAWVNLFYVAVDKNQHTFLSQEKTIKAVLRRDRGGWIDMDVLELVNMWLKHPDSNFGVVVKVTTSKGKQIQVGIQDQPDSAPFLQLELRENGYTENHRNKRTLNKVCTEATDPSETHCCLWPITIDFAKEFGWKWIIHPPKYEANYCAGDCSLGVMMPSNPYSHLLQQANGSPCCAPQKMSGMNMLYMDENKNIILGKLPNMRVERCGCV